MAILIAPVLLMAPHMGDSAKPVYDAVVVLFLFPLIVWAGLCNEPAYGKGVCRVLGIVSYPMYMLHMTVFSISQFVAMRLTGTSDVLREVGPFGAILVVLIALSWASDRWYDQPVRRRLTSLFLKPSRVSGGAIA